MSTAYTRHGFKPEDREALRDAGFYADPLRQRAFWRLRLWQRGGRKSWVEVMRDYPLSRK